MLCGFAVHGSCSWLCHQCAMEDKCLASLVHAPGDAPQAQPCSTRVRAVHLYSVIYTGMVVDGGRRRRWRGTDKQAVELLAHSWPGRAPVGQARAHTPRRGPARTLGFIIYIYIYIHMYVPACQHHDRACAGCGRQLAWTWPGRGAVCAQHAVHCSRGPARTLGFIIYIYIYISTSVSLVVCVCTSFAGNRTHK